MGKPNPQDQNRSLPQIEEGILKFWKENQIFEKSVNLRDQKRKFAFLEGPPTANGMPHVGHMLTRAVKDCVCRYQTMLGYRVERKAGWDTHGLPVEIEVEKTLGLDSKQGIEEFGIAKFNKKCKESVFLYEREWRQMTERLGYWIDMDDPYITLNNTYIESVWWSLQQLWDKKLIYKGHRVTPYCPRCGTPLSSHEVAQGYQTVKDPSVYVKFLVKGETNRYLVAWTTTPWTLISNVALAVGEDIEYAEIEYQGERLILAEDLIFKTIENDEDPVKILKTHKGKDLANLEYEQLFQDVKPSKKGFYVILGDFVSVEEGTGIVHIAPAFGEDDYNIGRKNDLPFIQPVDGEGKFTKDVSWLAGKFVKDADPLILENLQERGLLIRTATYEHEYPFCWRCDSPLLYYARDNWFIEMTKLRQNLLDNNATIYWVPEHIKSGRFGDFLDNVVDWSLSRERYWGTPLPIWECSKCSHRHLVGSIAELEELHGKTLDNLDLHKPVIDEILLTCPECQGKMKRVEEVIDTWYDSGAAPFAQFHYPFENQDKFKSYFPVDFISEAIDQTRGWFYSLLAISTGVFDKAPYKTVVTLGHTLDDQGKKMSKSRGTAINPNDVFNSSGADALRWYLLSRRAPGDSFKYVPKMVQDVVNHFINTLWNTYIFLSTYSEIDSYNPSLKRSALSDRSYLDRWIKSEMHSLIQSVRKEMQTYSFNKITTLIEDFLINKVSNWYVRLSRRHFWDPGKSLQKQAAYDTLWEVLSTLSRVMAPFIPFITEEIYLNMEYPFYPEGFESVHLTEFPKVKKDLMNPQLQTTMHAIMDIVQVGRAGRANAKIRIRQPLEKAIIVSTQYTQKMLNELLPLIKQELNVKEVEFAQDISQYAEYQVKPNFMTLGREFGKKTPLIVEQLQKMKSTDIHQAILKQGKVVFKVGKENIDLEMRHLQILTRAKSDLTGDESPNTAVFFPTQITPELEREGVARDLTRHIQQKRKDLKLNYIDKINLNYKAEKLLKKAIEEHMEFIKTETQTVKIQEGLTGKGEKFSVSLKVGSVEFELEPNGVTK
ncbi:MAG: isoleucine--tRNA ligase [Candidatus Ranarchaeia archaeon]